jgi:hypothetical protein
MKISKRSSKGQGIAESVVAAIILVPIVLALFDFLVVMIGNSMNDTACKNCARAAANQPDPNTAYEAAKSALANMHPSPFVRKIELANLQYNPGVSVGAHTQATIVLPIPFPHYEIFVMDAQDVEPIVGSTPPP